MQLPRTEDNRARGLAFYDRFLALAGLSSVQFSLLAEIHSAPGIAMQTLSKQLVMDRMSIVCAIQPLTRTGFIEQQADPEIPVSWQCF